MVADRPMDPERAAAVLGVAPDATPAEISAAFTRRARATHPDVAGGDEAAFRDVLRARDLLLGTRQPPPAAVGRPDGAVAAPRPHGPLLLTAWAALLALACFVSTYGVAHPLAPAEPAARWLVLAASALAFAVTGRPWLLALAVAAFLVTVLTTLVITTFGGLVGLLLAIAALYGLSLSGIARARRRRAVS